MKGPAPKPPGQRARTNPDIHPETRIEFRPARQPRLPNDRRWPARTREWWRVWRESAQAELFTATDWAYLLETAVIHARFWEGDVSAAAELRHRVAKFGATPEDRLRLRMRFADEEEKAAKGQAKPAAERYAGLKVVRGERNAAGQ